MTRTGTVPTLLADAGLARGWPLAGICCAPVPKKATSGGSRSGSSPTGQHAPVWLWPHSPSPALLCSVTSTTHVCCHPTGGTPLSPVPQGPHNQPKGVHGVTALSVPAFPKKKHQDPPTPSPTPQRQTRHLDWPGSSFCSRVRLGIVTPGTAVTNSAAGGLTRTGP